MKILALLLALSTAAFSQVVTPPAGGGGSSLCTLSGTQTTGYVLTADDNSAGCSWQTVGGASVDNNTLKNAQYISDGGSTNTITGTTTTTFPGAYADGQVVIVKVANSNSGATTLNINSLGAKAVTKSGSTALASGNLIAGRDYVMSYDGTRFQVLNFTPIAADAIACPTCVTSAASLTSTAIMTGAGSQGSQTPSATSTLDSSGNMALAGTLNKVTITAPASGSTLTIANGKTLTASNSLTLAGTDATVMTFPTTSATMARTDAANTFTGTQTIGALVATTVNGNTFTTGTGVLTIAASKTLTASNTLTFTGTDSSSVAFGAGGTVLYNGGALGTPSSGTLTNTTGYLWSALASPAFVTNPQTSTYQVLVGDFTQCKTIPVASGTFTITLVASGTQPADGQCLRIVNYGSGVVTVARSGQNINGATASLTLAAGSASAPTGVWITSNGTDYFSQPLGGSSGGGSTALSALTAASGSNTIANGDNPQVWNWATTTSGQIGMAFGETTASTSAGTPYLAKFTTLAGSTAIPVGIVQSLTGSQAVSALSITPTWNTSGAPIALDVNVTNTASSSSSLLLRLATGGSNIFRVDRTGIVTSASSIVSGLNFSAPTTGTFNWSSRSVISSPADSQILLRNTGLSDFSQLQFGGTTSSFPSLKRSTTSLIARLADDSADTTLKASAFLAGGGTPSVGTCGTIGTGSLNMAGFITSGTTGSCVPVLTFSAVTATTGWSCSISNTTTLGATNMMQQSASSTTTATFSGTTVSGDVLRYQCQPF